MKTSTLVSLLGIFCLLLIDYINAQDNVIVKKDEVIVKENCVTKCWRPPCKMSYCGYKGSRCENDLCRCRPRWLSEEGRLLKYSDCGGLT